MTKPEDIPADDETAAALVADLLAIEVEITEQQDAKGAIYKAARETYGKRFANGLKKAVKVERMDQDKLSEADEVDAEADRILAAYRKPRAPRATRIASSMPIPEHDADGVIIEPQSAPTARDLTADLIPQGDNGQVATHTLETANEQPETLGSSPSIAAREADRPATYGQLVTGGESAATNITTLRQPKQFRPNCLNRQGCAASGPSECYACTKAAAQRGASA